MSTEHQRYSFQNQSTAIAEYAQNHGFTIVHTYSDAAKSGVVLRGRDGLRDLLSDVVGGASDYKAILVYDVSRWGRFQDTDEAAHYEFLCRSAGVNIHYCAEPFENDGTLSNSILKALKRSMAAEFSRELGLRVYSGKRRVSMEGFNVGGRTPFGFRRKIVSADRQRRRILEAGDWKNVRGERLTLVHGPSHEVQCVRDIFNRVLKENQTAREIAKTLNSRGILMRGKRWTKDRVLFVLRNPVYAGTCIWGRTSRRLGQTSSLKLHQDQWVVKSGAFSPIVSDCDFRRAQSRLLPDPGRTIWTREKLLSSAKRIFEENGRLNLKLFDAAPDAPSSTSLRSLKCFDELCDYVGYSPPKSYTARSNGIRYTFRLYHELAHEFAAAAPHRLSIVPGRRPRLRLDTNCEVSLLACRSVRFSSGVIRWHVRPIPKERKKVTVLCLLNRTNTGVQSLLVFPRIEFPTKSRFCRPDDPWFANGRRLEDFSALYEFAIHASGKA